MEPGDFIIFFQDGRTIRIQLIRFQEKVDDKDGYVCFIIGYLKTPYRWIDGQVDLIYVRPGPSGIELHSRNPNISDIDFSYIGIGHLEHSSWAPLIGAPTGLMRGLKQGNVYYFSVSPAGGSLIGWNELGKFNLFRSELSEYTDLEVLV